MGGPVRIGSRGNPTYPAGRGGGSARSLPPKFLGGALGTRTAALKRGQDAGVPSKVQDPQADIKVALDYLIEKGRDAIGQWFLNSQIHVRPPSHVAPPLTATCFNRHVGTGSAASADPPIAVPPGGGPWTLIVDVTVPEPYRGVINAWGVDVTQGPAVGGDLEWRIVKNGKTVPAFAPGDWGAQIAAAAGTYFGPRFTLTDPDKSLCVLLAPGDQVSLQARNPGAAVATVAGFFSGWVYQPTVNEAGISVRTTLTDQR